MEQLLWPIKSVFLTFYSSYGRGSISFFHVHMTKHVAYSIHIDIDYFLHDENSLFVNYICITL